MAARRRTSGPGRGKRTPPPKAPPIASQGATGLKHAWGQINEEFLTRLSGKRAAREFREMWDNCSVVGGPLRLTTDFIAQTERKLEAAGNDPSTDMLAKHLCETALDDMESTWQECVDEIMTMAPFGWAWMEHWFKKRMGDHELKEFNSKHADGYYGFANIALRGQESLERWNISDDGDILGMWQRPPPVYDLRYVDAHRSVLFRTQNVKNNPEARSWLRPAWRDWWFCKRFEELEGIGVERDVAGYPDMQLPLEYFLANATAEQKAVLTQAKKDVERIRQDKHAGLVRPSEVDTQNNPTGFKFGLIQGGSRNATVFDIIIKRRQSRIAIALLAEFVLLGQDKVGSFALSSSKTHMFAIALGAVLNRIADVFNRYLFPRLMRANGLPAACAPTFSFGDIEQEDSLAFTQAIAQVVNTGVLTPDAAVERYVRDYLNLPMLGEVTPQQLADTVGESQERVDADPGSTEVDAEDVERALTGVEQAANDAEGDSVSLTPEEIADIVGASTSSVKNALRRGQLPGYKIGNKWRMLRTSLMDYASGQMAKRVKAIA